MRQYLSNYSIIRVTLNTESDTNCLKSRHGRIAYSKMATLVCPVSMCLGQSLDAELFHIGALNSLKRWQRKSTFWLKPLLLKQMLYAFSRKNKVFQKISGIDRYLSSCNSTSRVTSIRQFSFPEGLQIDLARRLCIILEISEFFDHSGISRGHIFCQDSANVWCAKPDN